MFEDPHLLASGGLAPVMLESGLETLLPVLPLSFGSQRQACGPLPAAGADSLAILTSLGFPTASMDALFEAGAIA